MASEKALRGILAKGLLCTCNNPHFRASNVGQQSVRGEVRRQPLNQFYDPANRRCEHNQLAAAASLNRIGGTLMNGADLFCTRKNRGTIASNNLSQEAILPERQPQRAANQSG